MDAATLSLISNQLRDLADRLEREAGTPVPIPVPKPHGTVSGKAPTIYGTPANRAAATKWALEQMGWGPEEAGRRHEGDQDWKFMQFIYQHEREQQMAKPAPFGRYNDGTPREDPDTNFRAAGRHQPES